MTASQRELNRLNALVTSAQEGINETQPQVETQRARVEGLTNAVRLQQATVDTMAAETPVNPDLPAAQAELATTQADLAAATTRLEELQVTLRDRQRTLRNTTIERDIIQDQMETNNDGRDVWTQKRFGRHGKLPLWKLRKRNGRQWYYELNEKRNGPTGDKKFINDDQSSNSSSGYNHEQEGNSWMRYGFIGLAAIGLITVLMFGLVFGLPWLDQQYNEHLEPRIQNSCIQVGTLVDTCTDDPSSPAPTTNPEVTAPTQDPVVAATLPPREIPSTKPDFPGVCAPQKFDLAGHMSLEGINLGGYNHIQFYWFPGDPEKATLVPADMITRPFAKPVLGANWAYPPSCSEDYVKAQVALSKPAREADTKIADPYIRDWQSSGLYN